MFYQLHLNYVSSASTWQTWYKSISASSKRSQSLWCLWWPKYYAYRPDREKAGQEEIKLLLEAYQVNFCNGLIFFVFPNWSEKRKCTTVKVTLRYTSILFNNQYQYVSMFIGIYVIFLASYIFFLHLLYSFCISYIFLHHLSVLKLIYCLASHILVLHLIYFIATLIFVCILYTFFASHMFS